MEKRTINQENGKEKHQPRIHRDTTLKAGTQHRANRGTTSQSTKEYVVIGGNIRLRAMRELKFTTALCIIIPPHTTREKLKAYTILDNQQAGEWDWEMVQPDWTLEAFQDWGIDLPDMGWKWKTTFQRWRRTIIKLQTLRRWKQTSNEVI